MAEPTIAVAQTRFGLGARPDQSVGPDPIDWLTSQIGGIDPLSNGPPTSATCITLLNNYRQPPGPGKTEAANVLIRLAASEKQNYMANAITTATPFRERMVRFWANHFAIQSMSFSTGATSGSFVREAIRPYVFSSFQNLLEAAILHPALLFSLDNITSTGYDSPQAVANRKHGGVPLGINENLGREILELFTVSPGANYTQADVDAMSNLLTGWQVSYKVPLGTTFNAAYHEPLGQTLLGVGFPGTKVGTYSALAFLATHHCTYMHLAYKLVKHFVSDVPKGGDVAAIYNAFSSSHGNLSTVSQALINLPNAWIPQQKYRPPQELMIAALRGIGTTAGEMPYLVPTASDLGEPIWQPPFPNGWGDLFSDWVSPAPVLIRAYWCNSFGKYAVGYPASDLAQTTLVGIMSQDRINICLSQESNAQQVAMLVFSSEFQRR